jgi:hypothetical protein
MTGRMALKYTPIHAQMNVVAGSQSVMLFGTHERHEP